MSYSMIKRKVIIKQKESLRERQGHTFTRICHKALFRSGMRILNEERGVLATLRSELVKTGR